MSPLEDWISHSEQVPLSNLESPGACETAQNAVFVLAQQPRENLQSMGRGSEISGSFLRPKTDRITVLGKGLTPVRFPHCIPLEFVLLSEVAGGNSKVLAFD